MSRDPRFDARSGTLNENLFKKSFSFLDDIKQKERAVCHCSPKEFHVNVHAWLDPSEHY